ncbi:MAG: hypothetical protein KDJ88_03390 [Bauldia sp.]|nr:hypothetical protein [Bauldia sp.]
MSGTTGETIGEQSAAAGDQQSGAEAELLTRGFIGRPWPTILLATFAGMLTMSVAILAGLPMIVSTAALFVGIFLVFGFRTGDMGYRLTPEGLARSFRPLAARLVKLPGRKQSFRFEDMRFYRRDRDWSRYRAQEVESLVIGVRKPPYRIVIHDMIDKAAFGEFADLFESFAARAPRPVERRPGFYQTIWAKLVTLVFAVFAVALVAAFFAGILSPTGIFRLLIVIIPGVIYMAWRVTRGRRQEPVAGEGETGP